eukprot:g1475.t1
MAQQDGKENVMKGVIVTETQKSGMLMFGSSSFKLEYEHEQTPPLSDLHPAPKPPKGVSDCVKDLPFEWTEANSDEAWQLVRVVLSQFSSVHEKQDESGWSYNEDRSHPVMMGALALMCLRLLGESPAFVLVIAAAGFLYTKHQKVTERQVLRDVEQEVGRSVWPGVSARMVADAREQGGMLGGFLSSFSVVKKLNKELFLQEVIGNSSVQMTPFLSIVSYNDCRYAVHAGGRVFIFASFG